MNSNTSTPSSAPPARRPSKRRNGKVARLPLPVREAINQMLDNNIPHPEIVRQVADLGFPGLHPYNICRWRKGGYRDWIDSREAIDLEKFRYECFGNMIREFQDPQQLNKAAEVLCALNTLRALDELETARTDEPSLRRLNSLVRMVGTMTGQQTQQTRRERLAFQKKVRRQDVVAQLLTNPSKLKEFLTLVYDRYGPLHEMKLDVDVTPVDSPTSTETSHPNGEEKNQPIATPRE